MEYREYRNLEENGGQDASWGAGQDSAQECKALGLFSRRAFFSLTAVVGALTLVGATPSGRIRAYADEEGNLSFVVYILSKEEVPIMAYDVSGDKPVCLQGVQVTLDSKVLAGKSVTVTTNDAGFAPALVKPLSWQDDKENAKVYNFRASITAKKSGYREFYVSDYFVEAGTPADEKGLRPNIIVIALMPDDGNPYLRQFSLDGEDCQYFPGDGCAVWDDNTMVHDIETEVVTAAPNTSVKVAVLINGQEAASQTVTTGTGTPHSATAKFSDQWLKRLKVGDKLGIALHASGKVVTITSPLEFIEPVITDKGMGRQDNVQISPGVPTADQQNIPFHKFLNRPGDTMCCQIPIFPVTIFADAKGRVGLTATLLDITIFKYNNADRLEKKKPTILEASHILEKFNGESVRAGMAGVASRWNEGMSNIKGCFSDLGECFPSRFTFDIGVNVKLDAMGFGYAHKQGDQTLWYLDAGLRPEFGASLAVGVQFLFGFIPVFVGLDGSFTVNVMLSGGMQGVVGQKGVRFSNDFFGRKSPNIYTSASFYLDFGATGGIGAMGLLSIGVRGYGYLRGEIDTQPREGLAYPHRLFMGGACFDGVLQLVLLKKTANIHTWKERTFYDNWKSKIAGSVEEEVTNGFDNLSFDDFDYVTDKDLERVVEATGSWAQDSQSYFPLFSTIENRENDAFPVPQVLDLLNAEDEGKLLAPVNGVVPITQKKIHSGCYSNPRIRIVHTDTSSFKNDRAFMLRVVSTEITVPDTAQAFASGAVRFGQNTPEQTYLVVEEDTVGEGQYNRFVCTSATQAPANAPQTVVRTRIAISEWDRDKRSWGEGHILNFIDLGEVREDDRLNSLDVDFDVEFYDGSLLIAVTSVQRPRGSAKPTYLELESRQYLSLVRWDVDERKTVAAGSTFSLLNGGMSLFYPHLLMQHFDEGDGPKTHAVVYTYACTYNEQRTARSEGFLAATVFDDMKATQFSGHRFSNPATVVPEVLSGYAADDLVNGIFEVTSPNRAMTVRDEATQRNQTTAVFSWSNPAKTPTVRHVRSYVFSETFSIVKKQQGGSVEYVSTIKQHSSLTLRKSPHVVRLGVCNQQAVYNFPDYGDPANRKKLKTVTFDQKTLELTTMDGVAETDKTQYFASFNGRRLYCVRTMEGTAPGFDEKMIESIKAGAMAGFSDGPYNHPVKELTTEPIPVKLYQLCEARWVDELKGYYDFYPIAQLDHIPDNIGVVCATKTYTSFTMANIPDINDDLADIYQVDVPVVLSVESRGATPVAPFAAVGDMCWYTIELLNVGNAPVTAVTMAASMNGTQFETRRFDHLENYAMASSDDVRVSFKEKLDANDDEWEGELNSGEVEVDEEGNVCGQAETDKMALAGILWPGRRRTFTFAFKVPTGTPERQNVSFEVKVVKVEDTMDDDSFTWPSEVLDSVLQSVDETDVPLLAADDYLYSEAEPVLSMLADDGLEFDMELTDQVMHDPLVVAPAISVEGEGGGISSTGDGVAGKVAGAAAAAAVAAGAIAAKLHHDAKEAAE